MDGWNWDVLGSSLHIAPKTPKTYLLQMNKKLLSAIIR
jgi:hypothetical protein